MIRQSAGLCLKRAPLTQRLRLLGVRVATLVETEKCQEFMKNRSLASVEYAQTAIDSEAKTDQLF